jgi:hypothetical protein
MAGNFSEKAYGLRRIMIKKGASAAVQLPVSRTFTFKPILQVGELEGDDVTAEAFTSLKGMDIDIEAGGISIDAWATLTGKTIPVVSGVTPNQVWTLTGTGGDVYPYVKLAGQARGSDGGAMEVVFYKAILTDLQGAFKNGEFVITTGKMKAIPDSANADKVYDIISKETAATLTIA